MKWGKYMGCNYNVNETNININCSLTNEQKIKQMGTDDLAKFLVDFSVDFMTEKLSGICDISCAESEDSCNWCMKRWLQREVE